MQGCSALPGTSLLSYEINCFGTGGAAQAGHSVPNRPRAAQQPEGRPMGGFWIRMSGQAARCSQSAHFIISVGCDKQHSHGFMDAAPQAAPKAPQCWDENSPCLNMKICRADEPTHDVPTKLASFSIISCVIPLRQKAKEAKRQTAHQSLLPLTRVRTAVNSAPSLQHT